MSTTVKPETEGPATRRTRRQARRGATPDMSRPTRADGPVFSADGRLRLPSTRHLSSELVMIGGVLLFLIGGTWDVSWHIVAGRETFWSPPHLVLYAGILLIFATALHGVSSAWQSGRLPTASSLIGIAGSAMSLASAPLDDFWHRVYGLDVTIWSPPHLLLIGGVALASFSAMVGISQVVRRNAGGASWHALSNGWTPATTALFISGGLFIAVGGASLAEYDFDVAWASVSYHPPLLTAVTAFGLVLTARAGRRVGGATLTAATFTILRVLIDWIQQGLSMPRPEVPLVLIAAPVIDVVLILGATGPKRSVGPVGTVAGAGAVYAATLMLVQWPYTTALAGSVWSLPVLARAALPTLAMGAIGTVAGWIVGSRVGGQPATGGVPDNVKVSRSRWPEFILAAASIGLAGTAIAPAVRNNGAPRPVWGIEANSLVDAPVVGQLDLRPASPVVGEPMTVRVIFTDATVLQTVGRSPAVPYESPRAGDVVEGVMQAAGAPGVYEVTFTPQQAGRRWLTIYLPGEFGRMAASSAFTVSSTPSGSSAPPSSTRSIVLRPEPGPDENAPGWLEPMTATGIGLVLAGSLAVTAWVLRRIDVR
ncbi:MAG: hypothetical protein EXR45_08030 [Chloroflexi bacterium]|nr:hypothetical protein [Chloroflexota bacterium]